MNRPFMWTMNKILASKIALFPLFPIIIVFFCNARGVHALL
jgi:hypothetical protein